MKIWLAGPCPCGVLPCPALVQYQLARCPLPPDASVGNGNSQSQSRCALLSRMSSRALPLTIAFCAAGSVIPMDERISASVVMHPSVA
ncbi:MAG TPA: hypothetical protein VFP80_13260 [Thermoanaerobaculia bacterium]|nr:hypothetical protein [Thermoanaerobaculia bacterium]